VSDETFDSPPCATQKSILASFLFNTFSFPFSVLDTYRSMVFRKGCGVSPLDSLLIYCLFGCKRRLHCITVYLLFYLMLITNLSPIFFFSQCWA
jgi:hypothetical protein